MNNMGLSHLDWNLLRSFVTIAQSHSITDAAQRLCLTQPAVSGRLKRLEEQIGYRLIERSSTMFELTEAGRTLLAGRWGSRQPWRDCPPLCPMPTRC